MKPLLHNSDEQLLHAAKAGDQDAFTQIHDKYYEDLFRIAYAGTRNHDDAKDVVQECFIGFWRNIQQFESNGPLGVYLFVSLRNRLFTHYKNQRRFEQLLSQPFEAIAGEEEVYAFIRTKELQQCIVKAINGLPARMREIFLMHREQELTIAEIAQQLGRSPQTVKNQLTDATQRVREHLRKNNLMMWWWLV